MAGPRKGVPRFPFVRGQDNGRHAHVGQFVNCPACRADGQIRSFHAAAHDIGGPGKFHQRIAKFGQVLFHGLPVGIAGASHNADGYAPFAANRLHNIQDAPCAVVLIGAAKGYQQGFDFPPQRIAGGIDKFVPQAKIIRPCQQLFTALIFPIQGIDYQIRVFRARAFILEIDLWNIAQRLHIFNRSIQKVIDHQVGPLRKHSLRQWILPLPDHPVIAAGHAFHGQFALAGANKGDLVIADFMSQHQRPVNMTHAYCGITGHHKDNVAAHEQMLANPPVLVILDFNGALVEKIRDYPLRAFFRIIRKIGQFEDNQGPALNQVFLFAIFQGIEHIATVPDIPDPLANVFYGHQAISPGFEIFSPGILNIDPGQQRA